MGLTTFNIPDKNEELFTGQERLLYQKLYFQKELPVAQIYQTLGAQRGKKFLKTLKKYHLASQGATTIFYSHSQGGASPNDELGRPPNGELQQRRAAARRNGITREGNGAKPCTTRSHTRNRSGNASYNRPGRDLIDGSVSTRLRLAGANCETSRRHIGEKSVIATLRNLLSETLLVGYSVSCVVMMPVNCRATRYALVNGRSSLRT